MNARREVDIIRRTAKIEKSLKKKERYSQLTLKNAGVGELTYTQEKMFIIAFQTLQNLRIDIYGFKKN